MPHPGNPPGQGTTLSVGLLGLRFGLGAGAIFSCAGFFLCFFSAAWWVLAAGKAIEDGFYEPVVKERIAVLRAERGTLQIATESSGDAATLEVLAHTALPDLYRRKVVEVERVREGPDRDEAMGGSSAR